MRTEIISGQSPPGTMYSVPTLADDLGVSTTPVREALLELARNGLIEPVRNRGFRVVEPTLEELSQLFEVRELLKCVPPNSSRAESPGSWMTWAASLITSGTRSKTMMCMAILRPIGASTTPSSPLRAMCS